MKITIIGLGYVGLPLAVAMAKKHNVTGFDINAGRINELKNNVDSTLEVTEEELRFVKQGRQNGEGLFVTSNVNDIRDSNYYIVTVPTPVDKNNKPDLTALYKASETVGNVLKQGDIVIYESTVYPGATEEECVPVLEKYSGLTFNEGFFVGYSPERINPGDKEHTVEKIVKVTSGSTQETAVKVNDLYKSVITAGTYMAPTIKVAEAAKVIENSQRDINIAFVNELSKIFTCLNIDTYDVLEAAGTKWNFLPFRPGLVGGHCIGVDPYYLAQKAQQSGYSPEIILAGRKLNDSMGEYIASQMVKLMIKKGIDMKNAKVLMMGITFKENCPDVRNTKIVDIVNALKDYDIDVRIFDPLANAEEVLHEYGMETVSKLPAEKFDGIIAGVAHKEFKDIDYKSIRQELSVLYDVKGFLGSEADARL